MPQVDSQTNPFILMMDPQAVLSRIEHSERLEKLHSRICRPLDKPQWPKDQDGVDGEANDLSADAADIDADTELDDDDTELPGELGLCIDDETRNIAD